MNRAFLFLAVALLGCQQSKPVKPKPQIDPNLLITCDQLGEVRLKDSYEDLEKRFGAKALTQHENTERGTFTTLWSDNPKQINIFWKEKKPPFNQIAYLEISDSFSPYLTSDSIKLGMTLRELVKKNGNMAITFKNFFAESGGGEIETFNDGQVVKANPCLGGTLIKVKQANIYLHELTEFKKHELVESFDKVVQRMDVELSSIRVFAKQ